MHQPSKSMGFCQWLLSRSLPESVQLEGKDPIEQCRDLLDRYQCLVVVDEVQSKKYWDLVFANLISATSRSCIIVVATEESVAIHCAGGDDLVCSVKSLQATAAFHLLQEAIQKNINSHRNEGFRSNQNLPEEQAHQFVFEINHQEMAFLINGVSDKEQASQNNGESHQEQSSQNNWGSYKEKTSQNNGESHEEQASQNNGDSHEEQASQNSGDSHVQKATQNNGDSHEEQASQNSGESHEQKATQKNGDLHEEQASQYNGYSHREKVSQLNGDSLEEQAFENNGNSFKEEIIWNKNALGQMFYSWFKYNEQGGSSFEEDAIQDSRNSFQKHTFQNSRCSFEEQSFQNSENSWEDKKFQHDENLLGEPEVQNYEKSLEEQTSGHSSEDQLSQNNESTCEDEAFQNDRTLLDEPKVQDYLKSLEEQQQITIQNNKESMSLGLSNFHVEAILSKSGGLPRVIVALGRYLAKTHMSNIQTRLIANFMQELQTSPEFHCLRGLLAWMRSYFWSCPPSLRRCMLYLLIFPPGQSFRRRRLVRRWIAEGFANGVESNSSDSYADELFNKLASQGVMQQAAPTAMQARYEVSGFFHEYVISRPMEEKIFFPLEVSVLEEGQCSLATERVGQHLAIGSRWDRDKNVFNTLDLFRLRSLTVSGEWRSFFVSGKLRVLRVLDLEGTLNVKADDLNEIGELLPRLKFLSLRGCKEITRLPDSISGLRQLQTLDIRHTSVGMLPRITKLQKLQYVRAGTTVPLDDDASTVESIPASVAAATSLSTPVTPATSRPRAATLMSRALLPGFRTRRRSQLVCCGNRGVKVLRGIGNMMALHTLGVIDVSVASGHAVLEELQNLTQLRKLGVSGVNRENCKELCSAVSRHAHLVSLSVWFDKGINQAGCLDAMSPAPVKLQSLKLYRHVDRKLPTWIRPQLVPNLSKLHLHMTMIPQAEIDVLGVLSKLRTLCLRFKEFQDGELQFQSGFNALQVLEITCNLQAVTFHPGVMYNLEVLRLHSRDVPSTLRFSGLQKLHNLKDVVLNGYYDDALKKDLQSQLYEHPREIKPVLKL